MSPNPTHGFTCVLCGQRHDIAMSFAAGVPDMYASLSPAAREARSSLAHSQCTIDQKWFFVRCCLEIPILGTDEVFLWGLWASVQEHAFDEIDACWEEAGREKHFGPYKCRLANSLAEYPETLNLKATAVLQPVGTRPLLSIDEPEHPLAREQADGITLQRAIDLASQAFHHEGTRWSSRI